MNIWRALTAAVRLSMNGEVLRATVTEIRKDPTVKARIEADPVLSMAYSAIAGPGLACEQALNDLKAALK